MKYQIDKQYLLDCFRTVADTPSPVGFYTLLNPVLEQLAAQQGEAITYGADGKSLWTVSEDPDQAPGQGIHFYPCLDAAAE